MRWVLGVLLRFAAFYLIWLALSKADAEYLGYGVIAVAVTTVVSVILLPPKPAQFHLWPARLWGTIQLVAWFLLQSVLGGADVTRRAVWPRVDIAPAVVEVDVTVPEGVVQQL